MARPVLKLSPGKTPRPQPAARTQRPEPGARPVSDPGQWIQAKRAAAMAAWLPWTFGLARSLTPEPLPIGIDAILAGHPDCPLTRTQVRRFLHHWTRQPEYRAAVAAGGTRVLPALPWPDKVPYAGPEDLMQHPLPIAPLSNNVGYGKN